MGIYIPNMEKPKRCYACSFNGGIFCDLIDNGTDAFIKDNPTEVATKVLPDCPLIEIVTCGECIYYDPPHVDDDGKRIEYKDLPKEAFDKLGTGLVNMSYGVNVGGRCCADYNRGYAEDKRVYRAEDDFCSYGERRNDGNGIMDNSDMRID